MSYFGHANIVARDSVQRSSKPAIVELPPPAEPASGGYEPTLFRWNAAMALFHTSLCVTTLVAGNTDLAVPVYKTDIAFRINESPDANVPFQLVPRYVEHGSMPLTWISALFFLASAVAHGGNAFVWRRFYEAQLLLCRCPTRWIEYSVSASIMILSIAYGLAIREYTLLFALAMLIASTMPYGALTELVATPASPTTWVQPLGTRLLPHVLGYVPQVSAWTILLINFYDQAYAGERGPPDFVYAIVWSQLVLFFSFGLVQLVQQCAQPRYYYLGEIAYQALSLGCKGLLGLLLLSNVLVLSSFDEAFV